jgi:hypothetical protein
MGRIWESHGETHGNIMGRIWEEYGKSHGKMTIFA